MFINTNEGRFDHTGKRMDKLIFGGVVGGVILFIYGIFFGAIQLQNSIEINSHNYHYVVEQTKKHPSLSQLVDQAMEDNRITILEYAIIKNKASQLETAHSKTLLNSLGKSPH